MKRLFFGLAAAVAVAYAPVGVMAAPMTLRLTDLGSGDTVTVEDSDGDGFLTFNGSVGAFTFQVNTGVSKPLIGNSDSVARLRLSDTSVTTQTGGTLEILLSDMDYELNPLPGTLTSFLGGVTGGTVAASQWIDFDNRLFGMPAANELDHGTFGPGAFSDELSEMFNYDGSPFSITERAVVTMGPTSSTSFDLTSTFQVVPEPGAMSLAITAVVGVGLWYRRRTRQLVA